MDGVDRAGPHTAQVELLQHVQRLERGHASRRGRQTQQPQVAVARLERFEFADGVRRQVVTRNQAAIGLHVRNDALANLTCIQD